MACKCMCNFLKKPAIQCYIVAVFTIIKSIVLITLAILYLLPEDYYREVHKFLTIKLNFADHSASFLSIMTLLVCSIWMLSGVLLLLGVKKNMSGCVLFHFVYGIFFTILLHVATVLLLLCQNWAFAFGIILISLFHIRGLMAVYQTYDLMQRGKIFGSNDHDLLVEDEDTLPVPEENV